MRKAETSFATDAIACAACDQQKEEAGRLGHDEHEPGTEYYQVAEQNEAINAGQVECSVHQLL